MSRALILVRNAVTHDARVWREAETLRRLGFDTLVAGVVSNEDREREVVLDGVPVLRLDPAGGLRGAWRAIRRSAPQQVARPDGPGEPAAGAGDPAPASRSRLRRLLVTAAYYGQGIRLLRRTRPALVHANDYNTMWIAVAAKLLGRSRLVYDCHELWPDRNGRPELRPWLLACEWLFVRLADATITTSPGYADVMARRYRVPRPIVVRNIPDDSPEPSLQPTLHTGGLGVYIGGLMPGRGLEEAVRALALAPDIRLRLIGPGREAYRAHLAELAGQGGVGARVEICPPVPPTELLNEIAGGDFGLMLIQPVCLSYELTLPNKLFEYTAAGLPVLASDLPVIAAITRQHGLGIVVAPADLERIASAMGELCRPEANAALRRRAGAFARANGWAQERRLLEAVYVPDRAAEGDRVAGVYASYARSAAKQRAWNAANPGNLAMRQELVRAAFELAGDELRGAQRILDIGCGTGWWLERLARDDSISAELHGLELLPDRAAAAGQRVPQATTAEGDARSLPFEADSFDVVSLFTVLSSLDKHADIAQALGEARRVLRPGGALLIWEPRVHNPLNRRTTFVSASLLEDCLAGMTVARRTTTVLPALSRRLGDRTISLYPWLGRLPALRTHRLVRARPGS